MRFGQVLFEGASAVHQDTLDRYVLAGADIDPEELASIWRDAGRGLQWRLPLYRRLLDDLRSLNQELAAAHRVRLIGGAPPIPWSRLRSAEELEPWIDREAWLHGRMRELLEEKRSTLAIYGRHHCERLRFVGEPELDRAVMTVLSVGPDRDVDFRRRVGVAGLDAELVPIDGQLGQRLVRGTWGEGHLYRGSRFGEVADLVVSYGRLDHHVLVMSEDDLAPGDVEELRRRDQWMAAAIAKRSGQAEP